MCHAVQVVLALILEKDKELYALPRRGVEDAANSFDAIAMPESKRACRMVGSHRRHQMF